MLRKETFDHVGTDIETYEMFQFELIAGVEWRISTKIKRTIAAKQSSAPGIAALDMITGDVCGERRAEEKFYKPSNQLLSWEFLNGAYGYTTNLSTVDHRLHSTPKTPSRHSSARTAARRSLQQRLQNRSSRLLYNIANKLYPMKQTSFPWDANMTLSLSNCATPVLILGAPIEHFSNMELND
jgi:hypothetical protein